MQVILDANAIGVDPPFSKIEHRILMDAHRANEIALVVPELAKLIDRAINRRQPFDKNGDGYRDALIWKIVCDRAASGDDVTFVSKDPAAFAEARKDEGPLAEGLVADLVPGSGTVTLFERLPAAIDALGLVSSDALEAALRIVHSFEGDFPRILNDMLTEDLVRPAHVWETTDLVNPFLASRVHLGVAYEALGAEVSEARRTEVGQLEASVLLRVRQGVTVYAPHRLSDRIESLGRIADVADEGIGVEIDATVEHRCSVMLDPIADRIVTAEALGVEGATA